MRKITISATAVAGVAAVGVLALPIAAAFADDDVEVKRDDDTPSLTTVDDGDDLDGNDPSGPTGVQTKGVTNTNGPTNDATNPTNDAPNVTRDQTNGPTNVTQDATKGDATNDATGDVSRDG